VECDPVVRTHSSLGDNGKEEETSTDGGATSYVEFESLHNTLIVYCCVNTGNFDKVNTKSISYYNHLHSLLQNLYFTYYVLTYTEAYME